MRRCRPSRRRVHPRERGESAGRPRPCTSSAGPSPRARGIHDRRPAVARSGGSIPASAGNPRSARSRSARSRVHPRERGESAGRPPSRMRPWGPSPRARGIPAGGGADRARRRSIPASAGNPPPRSRRGRRGPVHPRERGESSRRANARQCTEGPSPRARGIPDPLGAGCQLRGSIPASAGNPGPRRLASFALRVHPRERGESSGRTGPTYARRGPSPRARGIPRQAPARLACAGSIPASAGNPCAAARRPSAPRVHPRERGESASSIGADGERLGPSPRARGIRARLPSAAQRSRSIPASAGNPSRSASRPRPRRVHPRERGESARPPKKNLADPGPSPRARGIRSRSDACGPCGGSIPASAGNPRPALVKPNGYRVHPRERGESPGACPSPRKGPGPSPRARGIPVVLPQDSVERGSIPASAGNPIRFARRRPPRPVHPRERGESGQAARTAPLPTGPSPRARGIPPRNRRARTFLRSIPASAGNPRASRSSILSRRVHPRERGESTYWWRRAAPRWGPSPRARGIPPDGETPALQLGSIPASAGNPPAAGAVPIVYGVHPRERGESCGRRAQASLKQGPSPRARGIPLARARLVEHQRSIPASAGNPWRTSRRPSAPRVHPRERGESLPGQPGRVRAHGPSPRARGIRAAIGAQSAPPRSIPASAGNPRPRPPRRRARWVHPRERGESTVHPLHDAVDTGPSPRARGIRTLGP